MYVRITVTLKRFPITIIAVETQYVLQIVWVCICSLSYPTHKVHSPYFCQILMKLEFSQPISKNPQK